MREGNLDLLCHHAADVTNYRSPDFDAIGAVAEQHAEPDRRARSLKATGCRQDLLTGSVFEGGEGAGSQGLPDLSPYGLSKALSASLPLLLHQAGLSSGSSYPQSLRPLRRAAVHRLPNEELADRRNPVLLQSRLRPR